MAKKIDLSGVKEFLFNHGEKVALGTCAFVALTLGVLGLLRAMGASRAEGTNMTWVEAMEKEYQRVASGVSSSQAAPLPPKIEARLKDDGLWPSIQSAHTPNRYINLDPEGQDKRMNPKIFAVLKENVNIKYVAKCVLLHAKDDAGVKTLEPIAGGDGEGKPGLGGGQPGLIGGGGAATSGARYMHKAAPYRMVVVTAVFPMKQQMLEYQRALKIASQQEMFNVNRDDLPYPVGINVLRYEIKPNGEEIEANRAILMYYDPEKGLFTKSPALEKLLNVAVFDDVSPVAMEPFIFEGLQTPMPKLAEGLYPKIRVGDFVLALGDDEGEKKSSDVGGLGKVGGVGDPRPKKGSGSGIGLPGLNKGGKDNPMKGDDDDELVPAAPKHKPGNIKPDDLKEKDLLLWKRLYAKTPEFNWFHVLGKFRGEKPSENKGNFGIPGQGAGNQDGKYFSPWHAASTGGGTGGPGGKQGSGKPPNLGPGGPKPNGGGSQPGFGPMPKSGGGGNNATSGDWNRDAFVRFIDPDVLPGKKYRYAIQVRMANPNYKKEQLVQYNTLAKDAELLSKWEYTPDISIPEEYHLFALDQQVFDEAKEPKLGKKPSAPTFDVKAAREKATFQIHQWVQKKHVLAVSPDPLVIGAWTVGERVEVARGEKIGVSVAVQAPVWRELLDTFQIPFSLEALNAKRKRVMRPGLRIDMISEVIDAKGNAIPQEAPVLIDFVGGKRGKGATNVLDEETAVEALILTADGKLTVLNSRVDSDPDLNQGAREREERLSEARARARRFSGLTAGPGATPKGGPGLPGLNK
ncbi:MAG: hypothetical protein HYX68_11835 [Planctomycetes bacterium]|nr:hypothetical protein [Planctomycetota bacterium]